MTNSELQDPHMPVFRAEPSVGAVMVFATLHYAGFSATISPAAARLLAMQLWRSAEEAESRDGGAVQPVERDCEARATVPA